MGNGWSRAATVSVLAILALAGLAAGMASAQSSSSSDGSGSATCCCCCCLPVLLILAAIWLSNNSKSKSQPAPPVVQAAAAPQQPQVIYKEKETIREIVKVRCEYCSSLVDITEAKCQSCGAPLKR